jgi:hypothetical protein
MVMSRYDPRLEGTWRAVEVPGDQVMAAYFALTDALNAAPVMSEAYRIAHARREGFVDAVNIYCPDVPGFLNLRGHMLMAADRHEMDCEPKGDGDEEA